MERRIVNPWSWQDQFGFVQGAELQGVQRMLICAGQTAIDAEGRLCWLLLSSGSAIRFLRRLSQLLVVMLPRTSALHIGTDERSSRHRDANGLAQRGCCAKEPCCTNRLPVASENACHTGEHMRDLPPATERPAEQQTLAEQAHRAFVVALRLRYSTQPTERLLLAWLVADFPQEDQALLQQHGCLPLVARGMGAPPEVPGCPANTADMPHLRAHDLGFLKATFAISYGPI